jgi:hypothetical protein
VINIMRKALGCLQRAIKKETEKWRKTIAILGGGESLCQRKQRESLSISFCSTKQRLCSPQDLRGGQAGEPSDCRSSVVERHTEIFDWRGYALARMGREVQEGKDQQFRDGSGPANPGDASIHRPGRDWILVKRQLRE